jgi:hypothetical protein
VPLAVLLSLVCVSCLLVLRNWRWGLFFCVIVGLLQDPVRKLTPQTPAYLVLAFVPIYLTMAIRLVTSTNIFLAVRRYYPQLIIPSVLFLFSIVCSALHTLSYGEQAIPLALLGTFSYIAGIPAIVLGFYYFRRDFNDLDNMMVIFSCLIAIMLVGVPLEYNGVQLPVRLLGMVNYEGEWRRWYSDTGYVPMISGFQRSPEIMGWQAAVLVIMSIYLAIRQPWRLPIWLVLAAWGVICVLLSGRRKMFVLVVVFTLVLTLLTPGWYRRRLLVALVLAGILLVPTLGFFVSDGYINTANSSIAGSRNRIDEQLIQGPIWLLGNVGPFGYGVGTRSQGAHLLGYEVEVPTTEGGLEKFLVELGIVGTLTLLLVVFTIFRAGWDSYQLTSAFPQEQATLAAFIAFIVANLTAFTVAFQIFGDPLVIVLIGFVVGFLLSDRRLRAQRLRDAQLRPAPAATAVEPSDALSLSGSL